MLILGLDTCLASCSVAVLDGGRVLASAREVMARFTTTAPILRERISLAERLMWTTGRRETLRRMWRLVSGSVPEASPLVRASFYHSRMRRLLAGRVKWGVEPPTDDGESAG